ncbi:MAG: methyltransferase domain-containing protein [Solirubrobacterales bacterium]|nr:methyltransferase domain-containing protein [Solirubrobacterales bacterium]
MTSAEPSFDVGGESAGADDWDEHWARYAGAAEQNPAQAFRRSLIISALGVREPGARVLDIGSGTGDLAADLLAVLPRCEVLGVELSATGVEIARRKVPAARFEECDLLAPDPVAEGDRAWADHAICSEVLEHVDDPVALLRGARALLAPGCLVVVTVPGGPMSAFDRHIGHRRHFRPDGLAEVLASAGLDVVWARGAGFPFFNLYRLGVIALGERLIENASTESAKPPESRAIRWGSKVFESLFRLNRRRGRFGFQTVALACNPDRAS